MSSGNNRCCWQCNAEYMMPYPALTCQMSPCNVVIYGNECMPIHRYNDVSIPGTPHNPSTQRDNNIFECLCRGIANIIALISLLDQAGTRWRRASLEEWFCNAKEQNTFYLTASGTLQRDPALRKPWYELLSPSANRWQVAVILIASNRSLNRRLLENEGNWHWS